MPRPRQSRSLQQRASRKYFGRDMADVSPMALPIQSTSPLPRESLAHFWHPQRDGIEPPPNEFDVRLKAVHPDLHLTRPPARAPISPRAWLLWTRKPSITYYLCPGWQLLMAWKLGEQPLPLDDRLFAAIYHFDARHMGSALQYFDRVIAERDRERAAEQTRYRNDLHDRSHDFFQSTKITNIGRGNKFALHHDGTIVPSRGELNWTLERLNSSRPRTPDGSDGR